MSQENFTGAKAEYAGPARTAFAITPHDSNNEDQVFRGLYVGVGGDVVVVTTKNKAVTFTGVPTGTILPIIGKRVNATNTTATDMVGLA